MGLGVYKTSQFRYSCARMAENNVILRFDNVTYEYTEKKPILDEASFSVREGSKLTLMGQNGAGKSTLFRLILGELKPKSGQIHLKDGLKIGIGKQVMSEDDKARSIRDYFATAFVETPHNLDGHIKKVMEAVNLALSLEKSVKNCSGGQQARLLLAYALIKEPDILLLDEPTNNLDEEGIGHLLTFLLMYEKTIIIISHDADFLNAFTEGVIYLDIFRHKTEQHQGDYYAVVEKIQSEIERDIHKNAQLQKNIQDRKEKVNFFAHKGGKMRKLAAKMKDEIAEDEESLVDVRREDQPIKRFDIPATPYPERIVKIEKLTMMNEQHEVIERTLTIPIEMRLGRKLLVKGPNGIGKTTLLSRLATNEEPGAKLGAHLVVGYYRQDFSGLDFNKTGYESLHEVMTEDDEEKVYATAARFHLSSKLLQNPIHTYSEGQKGLLSFARLLLQAPSLLILDEPSNHINFRHLPVIAEALNHYKGAMLIVSHDETFLSRITIDEELDLGKLRARSDSPPPPF